MAHNLNQDANGRTAMMYRGETPWHKLGTRVEGVLHAAEAIQAAGMDWDVTLDDVYRMNAEGFQAIPGRRVIVREDNGAPFGIVTDSYRPIQNRDAFGFFDAIVAEGLAQYETAGALGGGERVWCMASMPGGFTIPGTKDEHRPYCLLTTTHDGTGACRILFNVTRVVCQNTLNVAVGEAKAAWSIRHTGNTERALEDARAAMNEAAGLFKLYQERAHALCSVACPEAALKEYLNRLVPDNAKAATTNARTQNIRQEIRHLAYNGKGNREDGIRGTWYAALNGVTEYVDHARSARGATSADKAESRFDSSTFGSGARLKAEALETALELAGVK